MELETVIQLLDIPVKMGFGALIAGLSAAAFMRRSIHAQQSTQRNVRRMQILEEATSQVASLTHVFAKYSTLVMESIQHRDHWSMANRKELSAVNQAFLDECGKLADTEAKLLMIGEKALERCLRVYCSKMVAFRQQVYACRQDISPEQITALKAAIVQAREQFYDVMSNRYDRVFVSAA